MCCPQFILNLLFTLYFFVSLPLFMFYEITDNYPVLLFRLTFLCVSTVCGLFVVLLLLCCQQIPFECTQSNLPYKWIKRIYSILYFILGVFAIYGFVTQKDKIGNVSEYSGFIILLHSYLLISFTIYVTYFALAYMIWRIFRKMEQTFEYSDAYTLTVAISIAVFTIATIFQQKAFQDKHNPLTIWIIVSSYISAFYLYFGGGYQFNPMSKCFWIVRQILAIQQFFVVQGFVVLVDLAIQLRLYTKHDQAKDLSLYYLITICVISAGYLGMLKFNADKQRVSQNQNLELKLRRQFNPFTQGIFLQIGLTVASLFSFSNFHSLSQIGLYQLSVFLVPLIIAFFMMLIQQLAVIPEIAASITLALYSQQRIKFALHQLTFVYSINILTTILSILILYYSCPQNEYCDKYSDLIFTLIPFFFANAIKITMYEKKLERIARWYLSLPVMIGMFQLELQQLNIGLLNVNIDNVLEKLDQIPPDLSNQNCPICLDVYQNDSDVSRVKRCGHVFHTECIRSWASANFTCPLDRLNLDQE